jgi:hypothetical protein
VSAPSNKRWALRSPALASSMIRLAMIPVSEIVSQAKGYASHFKRVIQNSLGFRDRQRSRLGKETPAEGNCYTLLASRFIWVGCL